MKPSILAVAAARTVAETRCDASDGHTFHTVDGIDLPCRAVARVQQLIAAAHEPRFGQSPGADMPGSQAPRNVFGFPMR